MNEKPLTSKNELRWMERALVLARNGIGLCSPNPMVGCVIVDRHGELAGEGWHEYDRRDHAEVVALRMAGERAKGGTAFVTLDPCNHTGRTGPCSKALVAAGVARVVVATIDPNPLVAGEGIETLRRAGIAIQVGAGEAGNVEAGARRLNEGFACWIQTKRPLVLMKLAMSLDGRIAPASGVRIPGEPYWITGAASREAVQRLRWEADAVLTGVGTILADDPLLTDRSGRARRRPLIRVVLDSALRTPLDSKLLATANKDVWIFTVSRNAERIDALRSRGVRVDMLADDDLVPLGAVLDRLGAEGILSVLTETGTRLNTALLGGGFVDRLTIFCSPQMMGSDAVPAFAGLDVPVGFNAGELERFGDDYGLSTLLRDPWISRT